MKTTRNIVSCILLVLYGLVLLHNFVPHTHLKEDTSVSQHHDHDHSHTHGHTHHHHGDGEQHSIASLLDFLLSIIEEHSVQFNLDDSHFSVYQSGKKLSIADVDMAYVLPLYDFSGHPPPSQEIKNNFTEHVCALKEDEKFSSSSLRAPPVSG